MRLFVASTLMLLLRTGYAQTDTTGLPVHYDREKYAIRFPVDWELDTSGTMGTEFLLFSPVEDEQDRFRENVNLLVEDLYGQAIDLERYVYLSERQIMALATNVRMFESQTIKKGDSEYHHFIYSMRMGILDLKIEQYCFVRDGAAYVLTFTAETDRFDTFRPVGRSILDSFALKN